MGTTTSSILKINTTEMEEAASTTTTTTTSTTDVKTDTEAMAQAQLEIQMQSIPKMNATETFEQKLYRKFSEQPLVPIGCLTTAYFLSSGIKSFYNRDPVRSQKMMRLRVGSQFATIMIFVGYMGMNSFNLEFAPGYHPGGGSGGESGVGGVGASSSLDKEDKKEMES
eukprot:CAMPEP_0184859880 /NCGR_PEP_ID=MMETSP0580-20130426/4846_1 /TAXON_ID=1118495 /ORGANISM="Dactyliosolen fragilissimus" /LENGTH=167 /DNA_ID=CAMNT_0027356739 /DNA_START=81 /DNA_END=584 /DNA_ORIENTATION=-